MICAGVLGPFYFFYFNFIIYVCIFFFFVVVVVNTQRKHLLALCCIIHKGNYIVYSIPSVTIKLVTGILESLCPSVCPGFAQMIFSEPFSHLQPNLVWWWII